MWTFELTYQPTCKLRTKPADQVCRLLVVDFSIICYEVCKSFGAITFLWLDDVNAQQQDTTTMMHDNAWRVSSRRHCASSCVIATQHVTIKTRRDNIVTMTMQDDDMMMMHDNAWRRRAVTWRWTTTDDDNDDY